MVLSDTSSRSEEWLWMKKKLLSAVTSAPKLPYNKDEGKQKNENVIVGT